MKLISWNVNGIRSIIGKGFDRFLKQTAPDVLCLQETRTAPDLFPVATPGYEQFWSHAKKKGYSGTAVFAKMKPISVKEGFGIDEHEGEGRVLAAEYKDFYLVNVYVPNSKRDLSRLSYRHKKWDPDFLKYLKKLEKKKPVVFCGDLNVAHTEIDLANPKANMHNHGFTAEEREGFTNFIKAGFVDTLRHFEKGAGHYTWWSQFGNCRARNIGWRIDYFLISKSFLPRLQEAFILKEVMGSDHCPVGIVLKSC